MLLCCVSDATAAGCTAIQVCFIIQVNKYHFQAIFTAEPLYSLGSLLVMFGYVAKNPPILISDRTSSMQILCVNWAYKPHKASHLERATTLLRHLLLIFGTDTLFFFGGEAHHQLHLDFRADNFLQAHSYLGSLICAIVQVRTPCYLLYQPLTSTPDIGPCLLRLGLFPRRSTDTPFRFPGGPTRCRESVTYITYPSFSMHELFIMLHLLIPCKAQMMMYFIIPPSLTPITREGQ
jgi:hypothetical protein